MSVTAPPRKRNLARLAPPATRLARTPATNCRLLTNEKQAEVWREGVRPVACLGQHPGKRLD
jgi:hypothetical protein